MKKILLPVIAIGITLVMGCNSPTGTVSSIYSMVFDAGAPVNQHYSKSYMVTGKEAVYDTVKKDTSYVYRFTGWGRCSCGAETDQCYLICDSAGKMLYAPGDSGNFGLKIVGNENEPYVHGKATVDSLVTAVDNITILFHGWIVDGIDTVLITNGKLVAPPAQ